MEQSEAARAGDLCAVFYYLKDLESNGQTVRCLMRGLRESAEVYPAIQQDEEEALFEARDEDEPVMFGVVTFDARPKVRKAGAWVEWNAEEIERPQAIEWRVEVARRDLEKRLETTTQWDALISERHPRDAKQIEVQTGIAAFGHEEKP
jgi:pyruvate formate-lyase activating enzyme-like uncharacterized protein